MRLNERFAKKVVERHLGVVLAGYDNGSKERMVDLVFSHPDGSSPHLGVEVTSDHGDIQHTVLLSALDKHLEGKGDPALRHEWWVQVLPTSKVKQSKPGLVRILAELEAAGIRRAVSDATNGEWHHEPRLAMHGVHYVLCVDEIGPPGRIRTMANRRYVGAGDDPDAIVQFAERVAAADPGNIQKLQDSGLDDRHLFVRAFDQPPVRIALENRRTPTKAPRLPVPLTGIWIAGDTKRSPVAFWCSRDYRWVLVDSPAEPEPSDGQSASRPEK